MCTELILVAIDHITHNEPNQYKYSHALMYFFGFTNNQPINELIAEICKPRF